MVIQAALCSPKILLEVVSQKHHTESRIFGVERGSLLKEFLQHVLKTLLFEEQARPFRTVSCILLSRDWLLKLGFWLLDAKFDDSLST